jgi:hypothetical protein
MKKHFAALVVSSLVLLFSCKKTDEVTRSTTICSEKAVMHYIYPPIPDMCQTWISVDQNIYIPVSVDTAFLHDSLNIKFCAKYSGTNIPCGLITTTYPQVEIQSMQVR